VIKISLYDYDKAMYVKICGTYDEVIFASPDEAFKINAFQHDGRVIMPFISVYRLAEFAINRITYSDVRVRDGAPTRLGNSMSSPLRKARGVPVTLTYQMDVYSNKRATCDGIAAELLLNLLEYPFVDVNIAIEGVEGGMKQQFEFTVTDNVTDNTSISEFEDAGRIFRLTIEVVLNDAIIYRIDKTNVKLVEKVLIDIKDLLTDTTIEQYIVTGVDE